MERRSANRRQNFLAFDQASSRLARSVSLYKMGVEMVNSRRSKFLHDGHGPEVRPGSYRATLVWQWLQHVKPGTDETGIVLRVLRNRIDMPDRFPHRTYLLNYMLKCRIDSGLATRTVVHVWNMYAAYRDAVLYETARDKANGSSQTVSADNKWLSR